MLLLFFIFLLILKFLELSRESIYLSISPLEVAPHLLLLIKHVTDDLILFKHCLPCLLDLLGGLCLLS